MFLLLVTTRGSNILEDLDTLRLLAKLVPEYTGTVPDEDAVVRAAFDLIFAFDEAISHGHKEAITVQQVKSNCEMESHEEKLHKMIIQSKINDTKDIMKRKALEIDKHKMETRRGGMPPGPGYSPGLGGLGGSGTLGGSGLGGGRLDVDSSAPSLSVPGISGSGGGYGGAAPAARGGAAPPKKGMQLGKAKGGASSLLESLAREEGVPASLLEDPPGPVTAAAAAGGHVISGVESAEPAHTGPWGRRGTRNNGQEGGRCGRGKDMCAAAVLALSLPVFLPCRLPLPATLQLTASVV